MLEPKKGLDLRNSLLGSTGEKMLAGGQKKRVTLAKELLTDPRMPFLDEPTSGLSSREALLIMERLRKNCEERSIAIVLTFHQPSLCAFEL